MKEKTAIEIKHERILNIVLDVVRANIRCSNPEEIAYHEYVPCGQCYNCLMRKKLIELGVEL